MIISNPGSVLNTTVQVLKAFRFNSGMLFADVERLIVLC